MFVYRMRLLVGMLIHSVSFAKVINYFLFPKKKPFFFEMSKMFQLKKNKVFLGKLPTCLHSLLIFSELRNVR